MDQQSQQCTDGCGGGMPMILVNHHFLHIPHIKHLNKDNNITNLIMQTIT